MRGTIRILAWITLGLALAVGLPSWREYTGGSAEAGLPLVPGLEAKLNSVTALEIVGDARKTKILRGADGAWRVKNASGYPADMEKLRRTLYRLSQSKLREKKTADPARLKELGLDDAQARKLTLTASAKGQDAPTPLAELLVGRYAPALKGTYVRRAGETQAWLASEDLSVESDPLRWVNDQAMNISRIRVKRVEIAEAGQPALVLERERPADDFSPLAVPKGRRLKSHYEANQIGAALEELHFRQARRVADMFGQSVRQVTFQTFDGLEIFADFIRQDGLEWVKFSAKFDPSLRPKTEKPAAGTGGEAGKLSLAGARPDDLKPEEAVLKEAAAVNARADAWYYNLPKASQELFSRRMENITEPATGEKKPAAAP